MRINKISGPDEEGYVLHAHSNRLLGFWGNLCGSISTFFILQSIKHGDYFEILDQD
jgi:hypothetical protein